ncbi:MAG: response regulator transcription factor [Bacteroidetes bacterium]|nr:response regulator transcription factor [Bacteroidota bacterium]
MITVILVEDIANIRNGIQMLINGTPGFKCTGAFPSCEEMLEQLPNLDANVALMDIGLKGMSGIEGIKKLKQIKPGTDVLILTVYEDNEKIFDALSAGACGYLTKQTPPSKLLDAIREVTEGGSPMSASIARKVVTVFQEKKSAPKSDNSIDLTSREKEVLTGLIDGKSYQVIADSLLVSISTVRFHIKNIYQKLHVKSQTEAVSKALREGLV